MGDGGLQYSTTVRPSLWQYIGRGGEQTARHHPHTAAEGAGGAEQQQQNEQQKKPTCRHTTTTTTHSTTTHPHHSRAGGRARKGSGEGEGTAHLLELVLKLICCSVVPNVCVVLCGQGIQSMRSRQEFGFAQLSLAQGESLFGEDAVKAK
jgi:hypothetical protein